MRPRRAPSALTSLLLVFVCLAGRATSAQEAVVPASPPPGCPASAQPEWSTASAPKKRELLRRCQPAPAPDAPQQGAPLEPALAPEPVAQLPAALEPHVLAAGLPPTRLERVLLMSAGGGVAGAMASAFAGASALRPDYRGSMLVAVTLGGIASAAAVHAVGSLAKGGGKFLASLLGALLGAGLGFVAAVGCDELLRDSTLGWRIGTGAAASLLFTTAGAVAAWELSVPAPLSLQWRATP